jgi:hypothetical protein
VSLQGARYAHPACEEQQHGQRIKHSDTPYGHSHGCRYLFQHEYNISLVELVDKIASPLVKKSLMAWTYKKLDSFPSPADYVEALTARKDWPLTCSKPGRRKSAEPPLWLVVPYQGMHAEPASQCMWWQMFLGSRRCGPAT